MDIEIEEVKQVIRKVEQQIDDVERQLTKAATEADVAYWRNEEEQLRKEEEQLRKEVEQLREKELLLLKADISESAMTVETIKKLLEDATTKLVRASTAKSAILSLSMSSISTEVAGDILKMADFSVVDGSAVEPAEKVSVSKEWEFDMGQYAREEDCYEPFFQHMVKYLNTVHAVKIRKDPHFLVELVTVEY